MLQITSIGRVASQGYSEPYHCIVEHHKEYFVKGLRSSRKSQINEWLCACMAQAVGLPIASFELVEVDEILYEELNSQQKLIGIGTCFGSQAEKDVILLEPPQVKHIAEDLQMQIVAFDWLIKNMDRTKGNSNLLFNAASKQLKIIDHNLAFDPDFQEGSFLENHIFSKTAFELWHDYDHQSKMQDFLLPANAAYQQAKKTLPDSWYWTNIEHDSPTNFDFEYADRAISRLTHNTLWRAK